MDPETTFAPVVEVIPADAVTPDAEGGGGWSRLWIVVLIVLKFGIPIILAGLGVYVAYRWLTKGKRNGQAQVAKVNDIAATLQAMTPEERQAYMEKVMSGK